MKKLKIAILTIGLVLACFISAHANPVMSNLSGLSNDGTLLLLNKNLAFRIKNNKLNKIIPLRTAE